MDEVLRIYPLKRRYWFHRFITAALLILLFFLYFISKCIQSLVQRIKNLSSGPGNAFDTKVPESYSSMDYDIGGELDFSKFPKGNCWRQMISVVPQKSHVLDVGCSTGYIGKYLKKTRDCEVDGVEVDEQAANEALKSYDHVLVGNAEEMVSHLETNKYDVILLMDVLEHLDNPGIHVGEYKNSLRDGGMIIASVPNIAYWMIRFELLRGRFDYTRRGILDHTHLRFFTLKSLVKLFTSNGYEIKWVSATSPGWHKLYDLIKRLPWGEDIKIMLLRDFPEILSLQFLVCAMPEE